jgi:hypothetical protein
MFFRRHPVINIFLVLISGVIVYRICRPGMLLFQWLGSDRVSTENAPGIFQLLNNYYGDLVWVIALCMTALYMAERKLAGRVSVFFLLTLPFVSELLQSALFIPGVFDWMDLVIYSAVTSFFIIRFPKLLLLWKN